MDWIYFAVSAAALLAGVFIGFKMGKSWGVNLGWHKGYRAAQAFYKLKLSHEQHPTSRL
jgi:hypothetical protein